MEGYLYYPLLPSRLKSYIDTALSTSDISTSAASSNRNACIHEYIDWCDFFHNFHKSTTNINRKQNINCVHIENNSLIQLVETPTLEELGVIASRHPTCATTPPMSCVAFLACEASKKPPVCRVDRLQKVDPIWMKKEFWNGILCIIYT